MNKSNDNKGGRESITLSPVTLLGLFHCVSHYRSVAFDNRARKLLHLVIVSVPIALWTPLPIFSTPASKNKFVTPPTAAAHAWHEWLIAALLITFIMEIVLRPRNYSARNFARRECWRKIYSHQTPAAWISSPIFLFLLHLFIWFQHSQIYFPSSRQLGFYIS